MIVLTPIFIYYSIFQEVQPQSLPQSQRKMVLDTIELLLQKYLTSTYSYYIII